MNRIIVPTDFSEGAWNALQYAIKLAEKINVKKLSVINTYMEPHAGAATIVSIQRIMKEDSQRRMNRLMERIQKSGIAQGLQIEEKSIHGELVEVLNSLVKVHENSFVVMGTQGETGALEKLIGSNASDVATRVNCPVLVIPPNASFLFSGKMLLAADFNKLPQGLDHSMLKALHEQHPAEKLEVVQVGDQKLAGDEQQVDLKGLLADIPYEAQVISGNDIVEALDQYIAKSKPDLLILIKMKMGLFKSLFHVSVTKKLAMHINIPLLILRGKDT